MALCDHNWEVVVYLHLRYSQENQTHGLYGYPGGRVIHGIENVIGLEKRSLFLTKMKVIIIITIMTAINPRTIPTMAPAERPPLSSSSSGLVGLVGILPLPGALVPIE